MKVNSRYIIAIVMCLSLISLRGQEYGENALIEYYSERYYDDDRLDAYTAQKRYQYKEDIVIKENRFKRYINSILNKFERGMGTSTDAITQAFKIVLALGAVGALVYFISKMKTPVFFSRSSRNNKKIDQAFLEDMDMDERDDLLANALLEKNYDLVIRIWFIQLLKDMDAKEVINWREYKTNLDYIFEIKSNKIKSHFERTVDWFEYVWYGNYEMDADSFRIAQEDFMRLKAELTRVIS